MSTPLSPDPATAAAGAPEPAVEITAERTAGTSSAGPAAHPGSGPARPRDRWGLPLGIGAFAIWGGMPLFFPLLEPAGAIEIIAHRVVWSLVFCVLLLAATRSFGTFVRVLRTPRELGVLALASVFIVCNWTVYVYGVLTGHVLDAALGYFINPLLTVVLAVVVLRERLRPVQWVALAFGAAAVVVISTGRSGGGLPWIALVLACSFGIYSLLKNRVGRSVDALPGLAVETVVATPFALAYLAWLTAQGTSTFGAHGAGHALLLAASGVITGLPLLLFGGAARRLPLAAVGMIQYLGPVLQFLFGLVVFHEHMPLTRWVGFGLVWVALVILTTDGVRQARATRVAARAAR